MQPNKPKTSSTLFIHLSFKNARACILITLNTINHPLALNAFTIAYRAYHACYDAMMLYCNIYPNMSPI